MLKMKQFVLTRVAIGLSLVISNVAYSQENNDDQELEIKREIVASPTKVKFLLVNNKGEILYSQNKEIIPDSTGNVSYSFGEGDVDQAVLNDLKSKDEKYFFKVQLLPAEEPVTKKIYVEKIVKEEVIIRDTIVKQIIKRTLTPEEQKEFDKELKENLKKHAKTGIMPYCKTFDPFKEVFVLDKINYSTSPYDHLFKKAPVEEAPLLASSDLASLPDTMFFNIDPAKIPENAKTSDALQKIKGNQESPIAKAIRPRINIDELIDHPDLNFLQKQAFQQTKNAIDLVVDTYVGQYIQMYDAALEKAMQTLGQVADNIAEGIGDAKKRGVSALTSNVPGGEFAQRAAEKKIDKKTEENKDGMAAKIKELADKLFENASSPLRTMIENQTDKIIVATVTRILGIEVDMNRSSEEITALITSRAKALNAQK